MTSVAPPAIEPLLDFVNTRDIEAAADELATPEALAAWLQARGLLAQKTAATPAQLQRAIAVREGLRAVMIAHHDADDAAATEQVNAALARIPLRVAFDADGAAQLLPVGDGVDAALGQLVATIPAAAADGSWQRAKVCARGTCQWAFYDVSRNRSRRWCSMEVCGNREKSRAFRSRQD